MTEMYQVKPLIDFSKADIASDVMYSMPPVQPPPIMNSSIKNVPLELLQLKERQDRLLNQLDNLIQQASSTNPVNQVVSNSTPLDLVVRVNPNRPPNSLKFFQRILKQKFRVLWKTHVHSSVRNKLDRTILPTGENSVKRNDFDIIVTVIFTDGVQDPVSVIDPSSTIPIVGETNIARMFGRLMGLYDCGASTSSFTNSCDVCFDACDVVATSSGGEKRSAMQKLEQALQHSKWLGGNFPSFVDAVASSILAKCDVKSSVLGSYLSRATAL